MLRVFIAIAFVSLFAITACLQDHEPAFLSEEIENIITGIDSAAWQLDVLIENGNRVTLSECEQASLLAFYRTNNVFQNIDIVPFCTADGGVINSGSWEVRVNEEPNDRRLILNFSELISHTYQIENISPFSLRLVRTVQNGESTSQEIREYVRVEFEEEE